MKALRMILDSKNRLKLEIIELLAFKLIRNVDCLLKQVQVTKVTMLRYIDEINEEFTYQKIVIIQDRIAIEFDSYSSIEKIYIDFFNRSDGFKLLEKLFFSNLQNYEEVASFLKISRSSSVNLIRKINKVFSMYDMKIEVTPVRICGDEEMLIQFYIIYFIEAYAIDEYPFDKNLQASFKEFIVFVFNHVDDNMHFSDFRRYLIVLLVRYFRNVASKQALDSQTAFTKLSEIFDSANRNLENMFKSHATFFLEILGDDFFQVRANEKIPSTIFRNSLINKQGKDTVSYKTTFQEFLRKVFGVAYKEIAEEDIDHLFHNYCVEKMLVGPKYILSNPFKRFVNNINGIEKNFFQQIKKHYWQSDLKQKNEDELYYLTYQLLINFPPIYEDSLKSMSKLKIGILSNKDKEYEKFIMQGCVLFLPDLFEFNQIETLSYSEISFQEYDLVIGSFPLPEKFLEFKEDYFCMDFNYNSFSRLYKKLIEKINLFD